MEYMDHIWYSNIYFRDLERKESDKNLDPWIQLGVFLSKIRKVNTNLDPWILFKNSPFMFWIQLCIDSFHSMTSF